MAETRLSLGADVASKIKALEERKNKQRTQALIVETTVQKFTERNNVLTSNNAKLAGHVTHLTETLGATERQILAWRRSLLQGF